MAVGNTSAVGHLAEMVVAFVKRFTLFMDTFIKKKNQVFGQVEDWWYRMEYQNRGGIHIHMVIWCDLLTKPPNKISAQMPRFTHPTDSTQPHPVNEQLRQYVKSFHIHRCRPDRCFKGPRGKRLKKCKYGFSFDINAEERLDESGVRYLYVRQHDEDKWVSPYILELLLFWCGHANVQRVTKNGYEMYLAKYIAKSQCPDKIVLTDKTTGNILS